MRRRELLSFSSVEVQFAVVIFFTTAVVLSVFGFIQYQSNSTLIRNSYVQQVEALKDRLRVSTQTPIWELNYKTAQRIIDAEARLPFVSEIVIGLQNNDRIIAKNPTFSQTDTSIPTLFDEEISFYVEHLDEHSKQNIGQIILRLNFSDLRESKTRLLKNLVTEFIILNFTILVAIIFFLRFIVLRPLNRISDVLEKISTGDADLDIRIPAAPTTELHAIVGAMNGFISKIQHLLGGTLKELRATTSKFNEDWKLQKYAKDGRLEDDASILDNLRSSQALIIAQRDEIFNSKTAAENATKVKSVFLANMSHEIRTPMNAIIGLSNLALSREMSAQLRDFIEKIRISGQSLLGIVNDILDISKIESGKMSIENIDFQIEHVMNDAIFMVSETAEAKGLELLCSIDPTLPQTLVGDPLRIKQILLNYIHNAIKFTEQGTVHLSARPVHVSGTDILVRFEVHDSGIGLLPAQIERLFQNFEQADATTTRQFGGTGLGLAISKNLAALMGGTVGVESAFGKGSTFWFSARLPFGLHDTPGNSIPKSLLKKKVLLVDDSEAALKLLTEVLEQKGFVVQTATSGEAALALASEAAKDVAFDFALIDWHMSGLDGPQTAQALQKLPIPKIHIAMMASAYRYLELVDVAMSWGVHHVLAKPVGRSALVRTLLDMADIPPSTDQAQAIAAQIHPAQASALRGARVLLVEDNQINQLVASELLGNAGLRVDIAENGLIGVDRVVTADANGEPYDLVLMDMQMPIMDGLTATRIIRQTFDHNVLPIVAMTANAMQFDKDACIEAGMDAVITKPVAFESIWKALQHWIKIRPGIGPTLETPMKTEPELADANDPLHRLRTMPGLDMDTGMRTAADNVALFKQALKMFVDLEAQTGEKIKQAIQSDDLPLAKRLAHTLKGLGGSLGFLDLSKCAEAVEAAVAQHLAGNPAAPQLPALQEALSSTLEKIVQELQQRL